MGMRSRAVPRPFKMPWGSGRIVEEATAVGEWHEPAIQLLEYEDGGCSIRFCYYDREGRFQRAPLLLGSSDLPGLRAALTGSPRLRKLLGELLEG